jgi:hypothetical protein
MNPGTSSPLNGLPVRAEGDMIAVLEGFRQAPRLDVTYVTAFDGRPGERATVCLGS